MIVIATHAVFLNGKDIYGPPHAVSLFLNKKKKEHLFIKHRLWGAGRIIVEHYNNGKLFKSWETGFSKRFPSVSQYIIEIFFTIWICFKTSKKCELFVGVDPLNAMAGNILKILGKTKKVVYFSADFALERFPNHLLNTIYLNLDFYASTWSSVTWSVSKRIVEYRKEQGIPDAKNKLLPNAPFFGDVKRLPYEKIKHHDLVIVSALERGIAFELLLNVLSELKKKVRDARLIFIGAGSYEKKLKEYVKKKNLKENTEFLGAKSHDDMFGILVKCGIGIALYNNSNEKHFRYFSDPMKVRDYLASGLPVIISGNSSLGYEVDKEHIGKLVKLNKNEIIDAILPLLLEKDIYKDMRNNAIKFAKKYDTYILLNKYLQKLDNVV